MRCWPEVENLRPHFPGASSGLDLGRDSRGAHCTAQIYKQKSGAITEGLGAGRDVTKWSHRVLPYGLIGFCPSARAADLVALSRQLNSSEGHDTPRRIVCLRSRVLLSSSIAHKCGRGRTDQSFRERRWFGSSRPRNYARRRCVPNGGNVVWIEHEEAPVVPSS